MRKTDRICTYTGLALTSSEENPNIEVSLYRQVSTVANSQGFYFLFLKWIKFQE